MIKKIILMFILLSSTAFAADKEKISIYSKYTSGGVPGLTLKAIIDKMNELDTKREYTFNEIRGAGGEVAIRRAFVDSSLGKKIIVYGASSDFTFNFETKVKVEYDKTKDFTFMYGLSYVPFALLISEESNINTVKELVEYIRSNKTTYYADFTNGSGTDMLNKLFINKFNLKNSTKAVTYGNIYDMARGIQVKEYTFTFNVPTTVTGSKPLMLTSETKSKFYPNAELSDDIISKNISMFFAPNTQKELIEQVLPIIKKVCEDKEYITLLEKYKREHGCYDSSYIKKYIDYEKKMIDDNS